MSQPTPSAENLRSELLDPGDLEAVRKLTDLKAHVFQGPRLEQEDLAAHAEFLGQSGFRTTVVYDGDQAIASFLSFDTDLSLPGGASVPVNGISDVVVLPTHKRRGLLRSWITADAIAAHERGAVGSVLYAAEPGIYGRFGFGVSSAKASWTLESSVTEFLVPPTGTLRIITAEKALELLPELDERARAIHPGSIRPHWQYWRDATQQTPGSSQKDRSRWFAAHADLKGAVDGVVSYSYKDSWSMGRRENTVVIHELRAATPEAERELWRHCASIDFVTHVTYEHGTPTMPLPWYLTDPRAAVSEHIWDGLWARILDVPAAMTARSWAVPGRVVFTVTDRDELASGTYLLEVDSSGEGVCTRVAPEVPASRLCPTWCCAMRPPPPTRATPHGWPRCSTGRCRRTRSPTSELLRLCVGGCGACVHPVQAVDGRRH